MTTGAYMQPGWYPDQRGVMHWWDGRQWSGQVAWPVAQPGFAAMPYTAVTYQNRQTSHGLHLFLTIVTGGMWALFVWLPLTIIHKTHDEQTTTRVGY